MGKFRGIPVGRSLARMPAGYAYVCIALLGGMLSQLLLMGLRAAFSPASSSASIALQQGVSGGSQRRRHVVLPSLVSSHPLPPPPPPTTAEIPPGLYIQGNINNNDANSANKNADAKANLATAWYVISAFMDTRPMAFGEPAGVALVAGGPREEVRKGKAWIAVLSSGRGADRRRIATIQCNPTHFTWFDTHPDDATHAGATIFCSDPDVWELLKRRYLASSAKGGKTATTEALGVCLVSDASDLRCHPESIVPIILPPNYPGYPTTWGDDILRHGPTAAGVGGFSSGGHSGSAAANRSAVGAATAGGGGPNDEDDDINKDRATTTTTQTKATAENAETQKDKSSEEAQKQDNEPPAETATATSTTLQSYLEGKGEIAVCVAPVASDIYTSTFRFWLRYYRGLGVSHVYLYMRQPSQAFSDLVDAIIAERLQPFMDGQLPTIQVLPWCQQEDSTYKCSGVGLGDGRRPRLKGGFYGSAGPNFGQVLQIQDCVFRAMGRYRWVLSVDLDEYIVPHVANAHSIHDIVATIAKTSSSSSSSSSSFGQGANTNPGGVVPTELRMQTAFYHNCLPGCKHANTNSCEEDEHLLQPAKDAFFLRDVQEYPRPLWAAARVSQVFDPVTRSKYMVDPLTIDRVGIHFAYTTICDRFDEGKAKWLHPCSATPYYEITPDYVLIHHARASAGTQRVKSCREMTNALIDWTFANFYFGKRSAAGGSSSSSKSALLSSSTKDGGEGVGGRGGDVAGAARDDRSMELLGAQEDD